MQWISCFILSWVCNQFINYTVNSGMVDFSILLHLACVLPHLNCGFWNLLGYKQVWEMRWGTQFLMQLLLFALTSENPDCHELLFFSSLNHEIGIIAYCLQVPRVIDRSAQHVLACPLWCCAHLVFPMLVPLTSSLTPSLVCKSREVVTTQR